MSSSFLHPMRPRFELGFHYRMWEKQSNSEIQEPIATFHIHLENWHSLSNNGAASLRFISSSAVSVSKKSFHASMSSFLSPRMSCLTIYRFLSQISVDEGVMADLTAAISSFSFTRVGEVMRRGLNELEISVHVEVYLEGDATVAPAIPVPVGLNAAAHGSKSAAAIDAMLERYRTERWDAKAVCMICLDELGDFEMEEVSLLPCSHPFHERCMTRWSQEHDSCPLCRLKI